VGLKALASAYPRTDAPTVERIRAAGAIPIARTNCPNFTVRWHTFGSGRDPWDRSRTPGASSGGEAAAIATGMTPLGLGNDGLVSLRWPAQCCGISVLKPALGRIPHASTVEPVDAPIGVQLTAVEGPDGPASCRLASRLEVLAVPSWRDPRSVPAPLRGPEPIEPVRVAIVVDPAGQGTADQVQDGVRKAASALEDAGYAVEEVEPPSIVAAAKTLLDMLNTPEIRATWQVMSPLMPADTQRFMSVFYQVAGDPEPVATVQSVIVRQSLLRAWGEFQDQHPRIVAPIFTGVPFEAGTDLDDGRVAQTIRGMWMAAVNALGLPAVAVPVGIARGLPQSVQVIGPRYREDVCLDAAAALEERVGIFTPIDPR
jgi:amidase